MAKFPGLPLWTDSYLADTTHLKDEEHGRYLLMLIHMWRAPKQRFPNDDAWLARKFERTVDDIRALYRPLIEEFFDTDGNWIRQGRLDKEFKRVSESYAKQSARAKSRWNKTNGECRGNADVAQQPKPEPYSDSKKERSPYGDAKKEIASPSATPSPTEPAPTEIRTSPSKPKSPNVQVVASRPETAGHNNNRGGKPVAEGVPRRSPKGTRIPDDWWLNEKDIEYANSQGIFGEELQTMALDFKQYFQAKPGKDAVKCDWHATWQRWVRKSRDFNNGHRHNGNGNGQLTDKQTWREDLVYEAITGPFGPMALRANGTCSSTEQRNSVCAEGEGIPLLRGPIGPH